MRNSVSIFSVAVLAVSSLFEAACGQEGAAAALEKDFAEQIQPLLTMYCVGCHNADNMKSGVRVDQLNGSVDERHLSLWKEIRNQVADGAMPPEDEPQPTDEQRRSLADWVGRALHVARTRVQPKNGSVRRLTVSQYRNTLRDLLGLEEDLTDVLPPDAVSKDGFANNTQAMVLSPLQVESYFDIAEKALDLCLVDVTAKPVIQNFRVDLGTAINPNPCPDNLILGADSLLLDNPDLLVTELTPAKPFVYQPFHMRTAYEFIEGYEGNATVRGWRKFDSIYHSVFACMRGTRGYPKGEAYRVIPSGLLLRPAIPSSELFGQSSTYGPMANFKVSLRELPDQGNFRVTVKAARYEDGLLLDADAAPSSAPDSVTLAASDLFAVSKPVVTIEREGIYQLDVSFVPKEIPKGETPEVVRLELGGRYFSGALVPSRSTALTPSEAPPTPERIAAFMLVRLPAGALPVSVTYGDNSSLRKLAFTRLDAASEPAKVFQTFEQRAPILSVYLGLRRDCGSTLTRVDEPRPVVASELQEFVFEGAINNFPSPDVEKDNVNYLAGVREIGVRSDYTDGRDRPALLIRSVEFEGPFYTSWPPVTHRNIAGASDFGNDPETDARAAIRSFATRAFRRPISADEEASIVAVWKASFAETGNSLQSLKDALVVVLTSPQFLFLIEHSQGPEPEDLDSYELASKLSYFLWNTAPDQELLERAAANTLQQSLDAEVERMIRHPRFRQFAQEFTSQWLALDKLDVVEVDQNRFPKLTRDTKTQLRGEPVHFLQYLIEQNLPLRNLVQSDFILANDAVAAYYDLAHRGESGFQFVPIRHETATLGGILSQASILAGLSNGREPNPVKRGAWLARKIIAEPPDDPPPNVPQIKDEDGTKLTLREKLERHRNQEGCAKCHSGIDPWGLPFEKFDAGGLFRSGPGVDARSTLPDGTQIADLNGLKAYLADERIDQVAFSFLKHLASFAVGRSLSYSELVFLQEQAVEWKATGYPLQDLIRFVVKSELFLKK